MMSDWTMLFLYTQVTALLVNGMSQFHYKSTLREMAMDTPWNFVSINGVIKQIKLYLVLSAISIPLEHWLSFKILKNNYGRLSFVMVGSVWDYWVFCGGILARVVHE